MANSGSKDVFGQSKRPADSREVAWGPYGQTHKSVPGFKTQLKGSLTFLDLVGSKLIL